MELVLNTDIFGENILKIKVKNGKAAIVSYFICIYVVNSCSVQLTKIL